MAGERPIIYALLTDVPYFLSDLRSKRITGNTCYIHRKPLKAESSFGHAES